jgi:5-methylcytosine-specific restriction endonuclease McrA
MESEDHYAHRRHAPAGPVTIRKPDGSMIIRPARPTRRTAPPIPPKLRRAVRQRDGGKCRYCGRRRGPFKVVYVKDPAKGGKPTLGNLVTCCTFCRDRKGMQTWTPRSLNVHQAEDRRPRKLDPAEYRQLRAMQAKRYARGER